MLAKNIVKLDPFHWLQRWGEILQDKQAEEAAIFRALMSRALLVCPQDIFLKAKEELEAKKSRRVS